MNKRLGSSQKGILSGKYVLRMETVVNIEIQHIMSSPIVTIDSNSSVETAR